MSEAHDHRRSSTGAASVLLSTVLALGCWSAPVHADAGCIAVTDPEARKLQVLVSQDAAKVVTAAQAKIDRLKHSASERTAAFYAVLAEAYSTLELDREAQQAASIGLALAPRVDDPVHLALLSAYSENKFDSVGLATAVTDIESALRAVERGSVADVCLSITLGGLQHRQDRDDLAVGTLTHAYRTSMTEGMARQRVLAAATLANVLSGFGDLPQALALNQEVIDWDMEHEAWLDLSVTRFLRGQIYQRMHDYPAAITEFIEARQLSVQLKDHQGVAFADLRLCQAQMDLEYWSEARKHCQTSLEMFEASQSIDMLKETQALIARIDLNQGRAAQALAALDSVLGKNGADMPPHKLGTFYRWRAQANAALKRHEQAYADLEEYVRRYVSVNDAQRNAQSAALRAHFEIDREIERNATLERELERQKTQLQWTIIGSVAGAFVIVLLTYILIISTRHRRELSRLAGQDSLTGVPNRRRVVKLATRALEHAAARQQPLTIGLIDLDHFKVINDRCGHAVGDHVLKEFARVGRELLRGSDIFGRWGGEEFLVVLPNTTLDAALVIVERLRLAAVAIQLPSSGAGLRVSISAGLASYEEGVSTLDNIVAEADAALYEAKERGRDVVSIADESLRMASTGVRQALHRAGAVRVD
jgi:diguanylate cyclase (GGDEF)-like protein